MSASAELIRHPTGGCDPVRRICAGISRAGAELSLEYWIEGEVSRLALPAAGPALRADDLWRHSCFEAFLQSDAGPGYLEFNFSPSGAWAAYRFSARRRGRESPELTAPRMEVRRGPDWLTMQIQLSLTGI
ncbi:MAG: DOMON-like domain-containing protein, partial [Steroidobacteraceae bacterium]